MKNFLLILIFLSSCSSNNQTTMKKDRFDPENLFNLTIENYKEMLIYYNNKNEYPNIDK
tara:strand:+ start:220 stop:396 length:177 start_codon:yes stop_codon:yes gene_type:complete